MAAALQVPSEMVVGDELTIAGTGFAVTHAYTAVITLPGPYQPSLTIKGTTDGAGAIDGSASAVLTPGSEGIAKISVNDGTSTVVANCEIFRSL